MKNHLEYKGYIGSAELDTEGKCFVGRLLYITDVIAYSALDYDGLVKSFQEAVDDYLEMCREAGDKPEQPCKGSFNVRIGPALHRDAALRARNEGISLNELVQRAISTYIHADSSTLCGTFAAHIEEFNELPTLSFTYDEAEFVGTAH